MRKALLGLLALSVLAVMLAPTLTAQPINSNILQLVAKPTGQAPQLKANGVEANISINAVPKGTGCFQVNGVCVTAGPAGAPTTGTFLTWTNQAATLPNSRNLLAGTNVTFNDAVANQRTINVPVTPGGVGINGVCVAGEIAVWFDATTVTCFADFTWDDTGKVLNMGAGATLVGATNAYIVGGGGTGNNVTNASFVYIMGDGNDLSNTFNAGAWGEGHTVSGFDSWTVGEGNTISGLNSNAFGQNNNVSGADATAVGEVNILSGDDTYAFGETNNVSGQASMAVGLGNTSTSDSTTIFGSLNTDGGDGSSTILGRSNTIAPGHTEVVLIGTGVTSVGSNSLSLGVTATPGITLTKPGAVSTIALPAIRAIGAATGKNVVCIDNATKILYTSSTGTDCTN